MARPRTEYLVRSLRATAREAIWLMTTRHEQGERPNILLFATRRGGSTWAMELIGANRGVRSLNQALETLSRNITYAQALDLPRFRQGQIVSLNEHEQRELQRFVDGLFDGTIVANGPTAFWRQDHPWRSDRVVLKITDAKAMITWFDASFDADIVWLTRHPIPQALSCIRNHWTLTTDAYLDDRGFVETHLPDDPGWVHDLRTSGSELDRFVLNWAIENLAPARALSDHPDWLHVRYEDCVTDPEATLERMADRLGLRDLDAMRATVTTPSGSSRRSTDATRASITAGAAAAWRWVADVDPDDIARCHRLLERLDIDPELVGASTAEAAAGSASDQGSNE